jgi:hypothetical protein
MVRKKKNEEVKPGAAMLRQLEEVRPPEPPEEKVAVAQEVKSENEPEVVQPKPKKKTNNNRNAKLSSIARLRTFFWFRKVQAIAGCSPAKMNAFITSDEQNRNVEREYSLYADGVREPSQETLQAVEEALLVHKDDKRPFAGTMSRFNEGPLGMELWRALEADFNESVEILNGLYEEEFGEDALVNVTFADRLNLLKTSLFLPEQLNELDEFVAKGKIDFFWYSTIMPVVMFDQRSQHPLYVNFKNGMRYDLDMLAGVFAFRTFAYSLPMNIQEADYMALGVGLILKDLMPEIADELEDYFISDFEGRNRKLFKTKTEMFRAYENGETDETAIVEYFQSLNNDGLLDRLKLK